MRVLILTSSTGGGHNMRARAFQTWALREPERQMRVQMARPLESSHGLYRFGVGLYNWIQRTAPSLHHGYYNFLEAVPVVRASKPLGAQRFEELLKRTRPDVLLSVHDSLNHGFFEYARVVLGRNNVRCVTYCGELHGGYGFSRHWVNTSADLFIAPVPETCDAAVKLGMDRAKTRIGGFLLRPEFFDPPLTEEARAAFIHEQLRLNPDRMILLVSASGRGANNHIALLDVLLKHSVPVQIVALCGRSVAAYQRVTAWANANPSLPVRVLPHNTNVALLMRSVTAAVVRGAGSATGEAIVSGCPILLNCLGGIMPQEWISVKFCRKHGIAKMIRNPADLARIASRWQSTPRIPLAMRERIRAIQPRAHPSDILAEIAALDVKDGSRAVTSIRPTESEKPAQPTAPLVPGKYHPRPGPVAGAGY